MCVWILQMCCVIHRCHSSTFQHLSIIWWSLMSLMEISRTCKWTAWTRPLPRLLQSLHQIPHFWSESTEFSVSLATFKWIWGAIPPEYTPSIRDDKPQSSCTRVLLYFCPSVSRCHQARPWWWRPSIVVLAPIIVINHRFSSWDRSGCRLVVPHSLI